MSEPGPSIRRGITSPTELGPVSKGRRRNSSVSLVDEASALPRLPQPQHLGSNGFNMTSPSAFDEFQIAHFALHSLGSAFPSISDLREGASAAIDTPEAVKKRIGALKAAHESELVRAHALANEAVLELERNHWLNLSWTRSQESLPTLCITAIEAEEAYNAKEYPAQCLAMHRQLVERAGSDLVERVSYAQLQSLMLLWKSEKELERTTQYAQMAASTRFPATIEQFNAIYNQGDKLRVAKYLAAPHDQQDQMRLAHSWGAETAELMAEYHRNGSTHTTAL
ncbi:hypothetical protein BKA62DRAFT_775759 [Auriculariales sp. MPI-PUGE-AT-0066]|nr:hypothetical protein BKA62DRAFT_775759 [Auriculariales sp. MPI-PUGE-AT-0066]